MSFGTFGCNHNDVATPPAVRDAATSEPACAQAHCPTILYDRTQYGGPRRGVEVDDSSIYWCELTAAEGNVVRAGPKDGSGPVRTLGSWYDFAFGPSLVVDDAHVYWLGADGMGTVVAVDKNGGNQRVLPLPSGANGTRLDIGPLAGTDDAILVGTHSCETILRVPKDGSAITTFKVSTHPNAGATTSLKSYGGIAYCANGPYVFSLDLASGAATEVVQGQAYAGSLSLVDGFLYFVNDRAVSNTDENLARVPLAGGDVQNLGSSFGYVDQTQYDSVRGSLFWLTGLSAVNAELVVYALDGGAAPKILFEHQNVMGGSASDANYLYWLSETAVTRLQKWP